MTPYNLFYKGYSTTIDFDPETNLYYGTFLHDKGHSFFAEREQSKAEKAFKRAVEKHLALKNGYTYKRCDLYTAEELLEMFQSKAMNAICREYIEEHQKDSYDTDDEIAIRKIYEERRANSMYQVEGTHSTKRYYFPECY